MLLGRLDGGRCMARPLYYAAAVQTSQPWAAGGYAGWMSGAGEGHETTTGRAIAVAVGVAVLLCWAHQAVLWGWVVDDAAISFAYARNLAAGDGLVAMPGGERVEGYSNPLWVAILALAELIGLSAWTTGKVGAALLSGVSVVLAWRVCRALGGLAVTASYFLAASAVVAIWTASGLENALFTVLVLAGLLAVRSECLGWAGLAFGGLALTRPEGVAYGGVVALWMLALHRGKAWRYWATWLTPFVVYEAFRWLYFAWPLPNTYYAKLGTTVERIRLGARGWTQLLGWANATGAGVLLVVFAAAPWGRALAGLVALTVGVLGLFVPDLLRIGLWLGLGVAAPLFGRGPVVVRIAAHLVVVGLAFSVYAGGDWMRGWRWMSLVAGPLAVLFAHGLQVWVDAISQRFTADRESVTWSVGVLAVGVFAFLNVPLTPRFATQPVDYPEMIARRLHYTDAIAERLGLDVQRVGTLDMDMGAHMWWSSYDLLDLAGLIDVPVARHTFAERDFFRTYVFDDKRPDFAHLHRHWANASGLVRTEQWRQTFVQVPPYDDGGRPHDGVWVRRSHVMRAPRTPIASAHGLVIDEMSVAHDRLGERMRVVLGLHPDTVPSALEGRITLHLAGSEVPIAVDGDWISPEQWRGETFRWTRLVELPEGGAPGALVLALEGDAVHTVRLPDVVPPPSIDALLDDARSGECDAATVRWRVLTDLHPSTLAVRSEAEARIRSAIAGCLARQAEETPDPAGQLAGLLEARSWDHRQEDVVRLAAELGARRYAEGLDAREQGNRTAAFRAFSDAVAAQPHRAWARRYAEEARP